MFHGSLVHKVHQQLQKLQKALNTVVSEVMISMKLNASKCLVVSFTETHPVFHDTNLMKGSSIKDLGVLMTLTFPVEHIRRT